MCKRCRIGSTRGKGKGFNITMEDVGFAVLGAVAGMAINPLANKALANQSEKVKEIARKALPAAKIVGGGYVAFNKKSNRKLRMGALGLAAEGGVELGLQLLPEKYVSINGMGNGDVFDMLGNTVEIPITPSASLPTGGEELELMNQDEDQILGAADVYESMAVL